MNIKPDPVILSPNEHPEYVLNFINEYIELCNKYNLYIDGCFGGDLIIEDIITAGDALNPDWIKQAEYCHYIKEES